MQTPPGNHSVNRLIEWLFAITMLAMGLGLWATIGYPQSGAFKILVQHGVSSVFIISSFMTMGIFRMAALYANGRWMPYGTWMRMAGSLCGAIVWGNLLLTLGYSYYTEGLLYVAATVQYSCSIVFELISCHRAANDSRIGRIG